MNRNIKSEIIDDLEPAKEYVCKRIMWNNYPKDKKYNYRKQMKEYTKKNLVQELSINYYKEHKVRILLAKHNSVLLKQNEVLLQKIKDLEKHQNTKSE